ncbi:hypothetical protein OKW33_005440 [Paraburkholderia atlantica]|uniref:hypothetical protein n=1 Tax=Paraburkholderia atlantica TaxID=2654982 RepID=UPI0038BC9E5D
MRSETGESGEREPLIIALPHIDRALTSRRRDYFKYLFHICRRVLLHCAAGLSVTA